MKTRLVAILMKTAFTLLVLVAAIPGFAQKNKFERSKDVGLIYGTSYYIGEVNPYKHFGTRLKSGGGISFRNNFNRRWTLKSSVLYHVVEAWDSDSDDLGENELVRLFQQPLAVGMDGVDAIAAINNIQDLQAYFVGLGIFLASRPVLRGISWQLV
jgi:hypothetical protein